MYNINYQCTWSEAFSKSSLLESWPFYFKLFASHKLMKLLFLVICVCVCVCVCVSGAINSLKMLKSACCLSFCYVPWPIVHDTVTH